MEFRRCANDADHLTPKALDCGEPSPLFLRCPTSRKPTDLLCRKSISHTQSCDFSQHSKAAAPHNISRRLWTAVSHHRFFVRYPTSRKPTTSFAESRSRLHKAAISRSTPKQLRRDLNKGLDGLIQALQPRSEFGRNGRGEMEALTASWVIDAQLPSM